MTSQFQPSRRRFLQGSAMVGAGALASTGRGAKILSQSAKPHSSQSSNTFFDLIRPPDHVAFYSTTEAQAMERGNRFTWVREGSTVATEVAGPGASSQLRIMLSSPDKPASRVHLRWQMHPLQPSLSRRPLGAWLRGFGMARTDRRTGYALVFPYPWRRADARLWSRDVSERNGVLARGQRGCLVVAGCA